MSLQNPLVVYVESSTKSTVDTGIGHATFRGPTIDFPGSRMRLQRQMSLEHGFLYAMHPILATNTPRKLPLHGTYRPLPRFDCCHRPEHQSDRLTDERKHILLGLAFASHVTALSFNLNLVSAMADDENKERRAEELDALRSFYEDDLLSGDETCPASWRIRISKNVTLEMNVPPSYPSDDAPTPKLVAPGWALDEGKKADLLKELNDMIIPGTEMAIMWAEHLRAELGDDDCNEQEDGAEDNDNQQSSATQTQPQNTNVISVVEFHHMLIGPSHKKEAQALSAAASNGIVGQIFMGGPSLAVVKSMNKDDLTNWLQDCKKAGKPGAILFWKELSQDNLATDWPTKLKIAPYAGGKGEKPDMDAYKQALKKFDIPHPFPDCPEWMV